MLRAAVCQGWLMQAPLWQTLPSITAAIPLVSAHHSYTDAVASSHDAQIKQWPGQLQFRHHSTQHDPWPRSPPHRAASALLLAAHCQHAASLWARHSQRHCISTQPQQPKDSPTSPSAATDSIWTPPNLLSIARAISAPFISYLILTGNWPWALTATAISGMTDWADGALARHLKQTSIIGSYLDPLADKVLVACVVGALAWEGHAPMWVAVLVVGRDVGLVTGMMLHRWRALGWRLRGVTWSEFFSTGAAAGVPLMKPLMISKVNTVLQLALVCGCMTHAWVQLPDAALLHQLELLTASTTAASLGAYMWQYATGRLLPLPVQPQK